jgi:hypothetical protein
MGNSPENLVEVVDLRRQPFDGFRQNRPIQGLIEIFAELGE